MMAFAMFMKELYIYMVLGQSKIFNLKQYERLGLTEDELFIKKINLYKKFLIKCIFTTLENILKCTHILINLF